MTTNEARSRGPSLDVDTDAGDGLKQRIKDRAEALVEGGRDALENLGTQARGQVRDRPLTSLAVAGGIGLLLGVLIARRR